MMLAWLERRLWLWVHRKDRHVYTTRRSLTRDEMIVVSSIMEDPYAILAIRPPLTDQRVSALVHILKES